MLPTSTSTAMPMGASAKLPLSAADLLPALSAPAPASATPPPQATAMMVGPGGTPLGGFPSPDAPMDTPYDVEKQADGSAVWWSRTEPRVAIGVVPAPRIPASLQPPKA